MIKQDLNISVSETITYLKNLKKKIRKVVVKVRQYFTDLVFEIKSALGGFLLKVNSPPFHFLNNQSYLGEHF